MSNKKKLTNDAVASYYTVTPCHQPINSSVSLPGSKSITNRALLFAALADGQSLLSNVLHSEDSLAFMQALQALGVELDYQEQTKTCKINGVNGRFPVRESNVWCQDAGTAARFLLAACANQSASKYVLDGTARLRERPLADLINALTQLGASFDQAQLPVIINGQQLAGGDIFIPGNISSQFLSGLLMIAPYMQNSSTLKTEQLISQPYITLTSQMMQSFGVTAQQLDQHSWQVSNQQQYTGQHYTIEPDLSAASYFFAAAAITNGSVKISNIDRENCLQGDIGFLTVLEQMGCTVHSEQQPDCSAITVFGPPSGQRLNGITVDMGDISDTMMTLAAMAPFADGPVTITNIANTRVKESDRILAMETNLNNLGICTESGNDYLIIYPGQPSAGVIDSFNDHRIAMACALIGLRVSGIRIHNPQCVAKTFPDYFTVLSQL